MAKRQPINVAVDLVPLVPGRGGAGGGIWHHLVSTLKKIDELNPEDLRIICLIGVGVDLQFRNIETRLVRLKAHGILGRILWIHMMLPIWCLLRRIDVLHRATAERPIVTSAKVVSAIYDFMSEYYIERYSKEDGSFLDAIRRKYFRLMTRYSLSHSSVCVFLTHTILEEASRRYGRSGRPSIVLWGGVDRLLISENGDDVQQTPEHTILVVAAFHPHKGHIRTIEAFETLVSKFLAGKQAVPRLVFRGHVAERSFWMRVKDRIERSPLSDRIEVQDYDPAASIDQIYRNISVAVLLSEYEGLGLPLLEAQMRGIPVVCSDLPVFREVIGDTAVRVPIDDAYKVAEAIFSVLMDKALRSKLVKGGYKNLERFLWEHSAQACIESYRIAGDN